MLRISISFIVLFFSFGLYAEEFSVFEKDGFYGIRNNEGEVTVPAVYERLGWSDGTNDVQNGVIGYREGKLWGLITVKNKSLTEQKFYTIQPLIDGYFKAAVKGKFSNQLFHGLLNEQGKTVVSFHYFTLKLLDKHLLVSEYDPTGLQYGIVTFNNVKLIPNQYTQISIVKSLYQAIAKDQTIDLYKNSGELISASLDSIHYQNGWKCFSAGSAGYISESGEVEYGFKFKDFHFEEGIIYPISFSKWDIYENGNLSFTKEADSVAKTNKGIWITYLNGSEHFFLEDSLTKNKDFQIKDINEGNLVLKNSKTHVWSVQDFVGEILVDGADSIISYKNHLWVTKEGSWKLYDARGKRLNKYSYKELLLGGQDQFIVKSADHWGVIGYHGNEIAIAKYDSIITEGSAYKIKYLSRWGFMNQSGAWEIKPEFEDVISYDYLKIARKGLGYTIFKEGREVFKTTWQLKGQLGQFLLIQDSSNYGLLDKNGGVFSYPEYTEINVIDERYIQLKRGDFIKLITSTGERIIDFDDQVQEVAGFGDGYFLIKKNNRWGYIDMEGRLRISNRYQEAKAFSDGMAAVKLRGKWGFINKSEDLTVQPYYDQVNSFHEDLCIVSTNGKMGLVNSEGTEILSTKWMRIERLSTGNYLVKNELGRLGILNAKGEFMLRPAFSSLEDFGNQVIVSQNGKYGLLDYSGNQLFKVGYKEIKISGKYTLVKY